MKKKIKEGAKLKEVGNYYITLHRTRDKAVSCANWQERP